MNEIKDTKKRNKYEYFVEKIANLYQEKLMKR